MLKNGVLEVCGFPVGIPLIWPHELLLGGRKAMWGLVLSGGKQIGFRN
jgi:hypothetical protein